MSYQKPTPIDDFEDLFDLDEAPISHKPSTRRNQQQDLAAKPGQKQSLLLSDLKSDEAKELVVRSNAQKIKIKTANIKGYKV